MKASELPLNPDGTLYHIPLNADTLANDVILVGDPGRVDMFSHLFDSVEYEAQNRELHALTGFYHGHRLTALSTGMGCDNIDIVMTELDVAARLMSPEPRSLRIVRIGTCGSLQGELDCGSHVASRCAIGLDGLMNYYAEWQSPLPDMEQALISHLFPAGGTSSTTPYSPFARPYCVPCSTELLQRVAHDMAQGITATAPGFYGPQARAVSLHPAMAHLNESLASFQYEGLRATNLEMETSAIYGFSHLLGHSALTVCLVIANRVRGTFLNDYHPQMRSLVSSVVERLAQ